MNKSKIFAYIIFAFILLNYQAFAETYSANISRNYSKAENLIELGKYREAEAYITKLLAENANDIQAKTYLAEIHSAQYKLDGAEKEFNKILEKNPQNPMAHNGLGLVYYRRTTSSDMTFRGNMENYYNKALQEFSLAVKNDPNFYQAYDNTGKILFDAGRLNDAEKYFKKALEIRPDYSKGVENYGRVLFAKNQIDAAIDKYREAIRLNSKNSSAYCNLGEALIRKGNYSTAIKQLQTSLYLFPNSAPVHDLLGRAYELQGNEAAAISEYKKSFLIKPEYLPPYLRLADVYRNRGDDEIAISELRNALSVNPNFYEAKSKIADTSLNVGKTEQAIKYYKDLLSVPNYKVAALQGLSKAYFVRSKELNSDASIASELGYVDIEDSIKQAIQYDPNNLELYLALLRVARVSHNDNNSAMYMKNIIENTQNSKINHIVKGEAYITCNDYSNAEREFLNALNQTNNKEDLLRLAQIYTMDRAYISAKNAVDKVLSMEPNNLKAGRILERIRRNEEQSLSRMKIAEAFYRDGQKKAAIEAYRDALALNVYLPEAHLGIAKAFEKEKYYYNAIDHYTAYVNLIDISKIEDKEKYTNKIEKLKIKVAEIEARKQFVKKYSNM
ncbi:MAG: tetratricopeptide repeat protein [bacterium]